MYRKLKSINWAKRKDEIFGPRAFAKNEFGNKNWKWAWIVNVNKQSCVIVKHNFRICCLHLFLSKKKFKLIDFNMWNKIFNLTQRNNWIVQQPNKSKACHYKGDMSFTWWFHSCYFSRSYLSPQICYYPNSLW